MIRPKVVQEIPTNKNDDYLSIFAFLLCTQIFYTEKLNVRTRTPFDFEQVIRWFQICVGRFQIVCRLARMSNRGDRTCIINRIMLNYLQ